MTLRPLRPTPSAIVLAVALTAVASPLAAQAGRTAPAAPAGTPLETVQRFFTGMRAHDSTMIRGTLDPMARLVTTGDRAGQPFAAQEDIGRFLAAVAGAKQELDERLYDPEVRVDQGLATVWARYRFYAGGKFSHCGVDAFQLARTEAGWRITQVADTRRKEGCGGGQ